MPAGDGTGVSAITGTDGVAVVNSEVILRLKNWSVNPVASESAWGDSDSAGYTVRKLARLDATASMTGILDSFDPIYDTFLPGDVVDVVLWQTRSAADHWYFPSALITAFNLTSDVDTKEVMEWTCDFGADGKYFKPGAGTPQTPVPT
jgi:hypothetical protein